MAIKQTFEDAFKRHQAAKETLALRRQKWDQAIKQAEAEAEFYRQAEIEYRHSETALVEECKVVVGGELK